MIAEKSPTTQNIIDAISSTANKVGFVNDGEVTDAIRLLEEKGIPNAKHEDYKYCNTDAIFRKEFKNIKQAFREPEKNELEKLRIKGAIHLFVINGTFREDLSDKIAIKWLTATSLQQLTDSKSNPVASLAHSNTDAFVALNNAFSGNGLYLNVKSGQVIETPIQVIYFNSGESEFLINSRSFIHLEKNSQLTLIERTVNSETGKCFSNFLGEKLVEENAKLNSILIQEENKNCFSVNTNQVKVDKYACYDNTTVTLSGQMVRNNHNVVLSGENSQAHLNGLFFINGTQLVDNHTLMDHQVPNCESNELYKGVAAEKSTGVFNGKIYVRKDAQKTNAYQSSKNILLSDDSTINTKPQLEIYANDVKCSHGTSTGRIDENALFYLKARGIGETSARKLLLHAFAQEVVERISVAEIKTYVEEKLNEQF